MRTALKFALAALYLLAPFGLLLALGMLPLPSSHAGRLFRDNLASALAIVGFSIVILEVVVICRVRPISNLFGCDRVMRTHQLFARTGALFLLAHPFLYSLWGNVARPGERSPAALGLDGASLLSGAVAWTALIALVVLAMSRHEAGRNYDRWRKWHAALAVVVIAGGLHHTLQAGLYSSIGWVAAVWWALVGGAAAVLLWLYLVRPWMASGRPYALVACRPVAQHIWSLELRAEGRVVQAPLPGQFFWIKHTSPWAFADHPFSVFRASNDGRSLSFLVKESGAFTAAITHFPAGKTFYLDGPYGNFQIPSRAQTVVMVAGGIGIAPMIGLLQQAATRQDPRRFVLIYATQTPADQMNAAIAVEQGGLTGFTMERVVESADSGWTASVGQCDGEFVVAACQRAGVDLSSEGLCFMVCGPAAMADSVERVLVAHAVPMASIHTERYRYDVGEDSPIARRSVRRWLAISLTMLMAAGLLAAQLSSLG